MKVIFLDLDGVLNSERYDAGREQDGLTYIDETRLPLLKEIVDRTNAKIVFTSTRRDHWNRDFELCDDDGKYIVRSLGRYGLEIYDKTPEIGSFTERKEEIEKWLAAHSDVDKFVIIDDFAFGWGNFRPAYVKTDPQSTNGLEEEQVAQAIDILNTVDMQLAEEPFYAIKSGEKRVEIRLYDEKRQKLRVGDVIRFRLRGTERILRKRVTSLRRFSSFYQLFSSELYPDCGCKNASVGACTDGMYKYYTKEEEEKYGALAIGLGGVSFAVVGDSISSCAGYVPHGYAVYYNAERLRENGMNGVQDMWWHKVIDRLGGLLCVNNSYSGSFTAGSAFPAACAKERCLNLHNGDNLPDYILLYIGTNDYIFGTPLGHGAAERDERTFYGAYRKMIGRIKENYPKAKIVCGTLLSAYPVGEKEPRPFYSVAALEEYNEAIRAVAKEEDCLTADLAEEGVKFESLDGTHPTANGHNTLAEAWSGRLEKIIEQ